VVGLLAMVIGAGAVGYTLYDQYWTQLPPLNRLLEYDPPVATRVYADDGALVGEFYFEKRYLTPIDQIPAVVRYAFVAAEDSEFYSHPGIDLKGITRAFIANMRAGDVVQGGSTITQQVVKALLLSPERSYRRKLREVMLSLKLEREATKDEILYLYLNQIYLGDGNYGIGAAARSYFGKDVSEIGLAEAALLAGLPKAPSRYSPTRNPDGALTRQRYVLGRMLEEGFVTLNDYRTALRKGLSVLEQKGRAQVGSYYLEYVRRNLVDRFGDRAPYYKGFRVHTAVSLDVQRMAEDAVRGGIEQLDLQLGYWGPVGHLVRAEVDERVAADREREELDSLEEGSAYEAVVTQVAPGSITATLGKLVSEIDVSGLRWNEEVEPTLRRFQVGDLVEVTPLKSDDGVSLALTQTPQVASALVALEPYTGHVKAMVGGYDFARSQFNRAVQAYRQPGSSFKPLIYAAALDNGYTPASIVVDAPIQIVDHDQIWNPQNFNRKYYGPTSLRHALEKSRNVVTVRVVQDLGIPTVIDYVSRFRFSRPIGRNLSVALGTSEVTPLELARAYTAFANAGRIMEPIFITRIEDSAGNLIENTEVQSTEVTSPQTAYLITSMLEGVVQNGTGRSVKVLSRPVAGKTGTTDEQRDAWFVGYTPGLLAAAWVGYDDQRSLGNEGTGGRVAAPLWLRFMQRALEGQPVADFPMPDGIECTHIDPETGLRARADNLKGYLECFRSGTAPREYTPVWRYDPALGTETLVTGEADLPAGDGAKMPVQREDDQAFQ
jgi:penicillin-binding protein 1A